MKSILIKNKIPFSLFFLKAAEVGKSLRRKWISFIFLDRYERGEIEFSGAGFRMK